MKSGSDKEVCGMYMLQVKDGAIKIFVQVSLRSDRIMAVDKFFSSGMFKKIDIGRDVICHQALLDEVVCNSWALWNTNLWKRDVDFPFSRCRVTRPVSASAFRTN